MPTYLSPTDCDGKNDDSVNADGNRTEPLTMESVYKEIRELAAIFDVRERGEAFVAELEDRYETAAGAIEATDVTLAFWFADTSTPPTSRVAAVPPASSPPRSVPRTCSPTPPTSGRR